MRLSQLEGHLCKCAAQTPPHARTRPGKLFARTALDRNEVTRRMLLAGDIGGTKTDLAIYSRESGPHAPMIQKQFASSDYQSLEMMAAEFLAEANLPVQRAFFDVAGPVIEGHVKTTNLPWEMDEISLATHLQLTSVHLMNDLEAVARAVPVLRPVDIVTVNEGEPVLNGTIALIAPGTGLGESFLTWDGAHY